MHRRQRTPSRRGLPRPSMRSGRSTNSPSPISVAAPTTGAAGWTTRSRTSCRSWAPARSLGLRVNCLDGTGVQLMPTARIKVAVPTEATPELLAKLEAERSKRELVARTQGKGTAVDVATAQFPAERRIVEFTGRRLGRIDDGDCELLQQLLPQVLEPLGIRDGTRLLAGVHAAHDAVRFGPPQARIAPREAGRGRRAGQALNPGPRFSLRTAIRRCGSPPAPVGRRAGRCVARSMCPPRRIRCRGRARDPRPRSPWPTSGRRRVVRRQIAARECETTVAYPAGQFQADP